MMTPRLEPDPVVREEEVPLVGADILRLRSVADDAGSEAGVEAALAWVTEGKALPATVLPLYGTHVVWSPARAVCIAPADRLGQVCDAVVEFSRCESGIRDLEAGIVAGLSDLDGDATAVFDVDLDDARCRQLAGRYRAAVGIQAGLARLAPQVHTPRLHPPTLAGQIAERLRDRTRLAERLEFAVQQAEVLVRVYEQCGQRASDAVISGRHLRLEWAIVVLLAAETLFLFVDLLASSSTPT